jgi:hypothetical protein
MQTVLKLLTIANAFYQRLALLTMKVLLHWIH